MGMITSDKRSPWQALFRGFMCRCPNCNKGGLYKSFLKVNDHCGHCHEALHHHRADDAPPYFTIFIVGHIVVPLVMAVELAYRPSLLVHAALWLPLILLGTYWLLPRVKGALIGIQWALRMHGFDPHHDEASEYGGHNSP